MATKTLLPLLWTDFPALQLVRTGRLVRLIGKITFACLVIAIISMIFVPWQQTAKGVGMVVALDPQERPQPVLSPAKGVIGDIKEGLREGTYVEQGELLLMIRPFANEGVSQLEMQIAAIENKKSNALSSLTLMEQAAEMQFSGGESLTESLNNDLEAARQKWKQAQNEYAALEAELNDKRNQLRIATEVAGQGLVSREELFSKQQAVEAQISKLNKQQNAIEEAFATLNSKEQEIASKIQDIDIKNRQANAKILEETQKLRTIEKELIDLQTKRQELDRNEVKAPRSGYIQKWTGLSGSDTVKEGDQLFVIVPNATELAVEMKVSGNDMPLVHEGDEVRLQFEGWPAVQFVGWPSVAVGTFGGKVNRVYPTDDGNGYFRIIVTAEHDNAGESTWPDDRYLRQGVRANGWVLLKQVPLGYEIWRQLNGFPPVVADEEPKDKVGKPKLPKL